MDYCDVLSICNNTNISVPEEQANVVEIATRIKLLLNCDFSFVPCRITASKMKTVITINQLRALSKVHAIPNYTNLYQKDGVGIPRYVLFGLHLICQFLVASPDGLVSWDCCSVRGIEMKRLCLKSYKLDSVYGILLGEGKKTVKGRETDTKQKPPVFLPGPNTASVKNVSAYFVFWTENFATHFV